MLKQHAPEVVLLVDGQAVTRTLIAGYLRECGYDVIEAVNEAEALLALEGLKIDIVVSDVSFEGEGNGFALASWVRQNRPGLQMFLSGSVERSAAVAADICEEGPSDKPYHPQHLVDLVKRMRAGR
jgi:CheY-like chemotaxis protein